jgi:hypothetical protein
LLHGDRHQDADAVLGDQLPVLQLALPMTDSVSGVWTSVGHRW